MRFDGPTLFADNAGYGMMLPDLDSIPNPASRFLSSPNPATRFINPAPLAGNTFSSPGLSLGLQHASSEGTATELGVLDPPVQTRMKEEENDSRSGSGSENVENVFDEQGGPPRKKKRYHRHTARQIQEMEGLFKVCPHPDDKQRQELSRELGLHPRQVKFWFQNRRTQMKTHQERAENTFLRRELEKLRLENITIREALRSCPSCGGPTILEDPSVESQQLRLENSYLKEELNRVTSFTSRMFGMSLLPPQAPQFSTGSPNFSTQGVEGLPLPPFMTDDSTGRSVVRNNGQKNAVFQLSQCAMDELIQLSFSQNVAWSPSAIGTMEVLHYDEYVRQFPKFAEGRTKTNTTRDSGIVMIDAVTLVNIYMDPEKWMEMFSTNVAKAITLEILSSVPGSLSGTLQLMYAEIQVLSPLIETRDMYFFRYCKQHQDNSWAVVDFSLDGLHGATHKAQAKVTSPRFPSGIVIRQHNDFSEVVVVEHMACEDHTVHQLFDALISSGGAYGARRWLATLQRECEALNCGIRENLQAVGDQDVPSRQAILKLSRRMTNTFCRSIGASSSHKWTTLTGNLSEQVRIMTRKCVDNPGEPHGVVLCAGTTIWLPSSPATVFEYLRMQHVRNEWGVGDEIVHINKGRAPGNEISVFRVATVNASDDQMLVLQESCTDDSGSVLVYAPVEDSVMNGLTQGADPAHTAILPSGFAVMPDGSAQNEASGSLLTIVTQILLSSVPSAKLSVDSIYAINTLITGSVQKVKAALASTNTNEL